MGTSGNRDCQRASRSDLKDFTDEALTISAGSLFQKGTLWTRIRRELKFVNLITPPKRCIVTCMGIV